MTQAMAMKLLQPYKAVLPQLSMIAEGFVGSVWVLQLLSFAEHDKSNNSTQEVNNSYQFDISKSKVSSDTLSNKEDNDCGANVVSHVRALCGPYEPIIARELSPQSLRARFGVDTVHNAVHCCELPHDGPLYADFFFPRPDKL
uniref:Nucleoside diphosphate kinase 7 n=1 Tax=Lygus hesperus TaxID=30085 RepID=A0A0A9ZEW9_LYGHE